MRFLFVGMLLLLSSALDAQKKYTISGYVKDGDTGEGMIATTVKVAGTSIGTTSNEYGFYSLSLEPGTYNLEWSFIGYDTRKETITLDKDITRTVEIGFSQTTLNEVVVTGERADVNVTSVEMSVEKLDIAQVKKMPQLLGEADIIRSIQLLPGVTTVGEGATGFNVRGGNIDQNLILLDESPVFSSSHLFGFFSVFNADAIKDAKLYKGGIPSKYGGRLSSVLDIRQKDGNMKRLGVTGGIGLLFSRLMLEGPIVKDKVSFLISGRRSYFDLFFPLAPDDRINSSRLYFYDLNGKMNWTINDKNRLFLSGYTGDDIFNLSGLFRTQWGNRTATLRWNHLFSDKLFANFTGIYSNYNYSLGITQDALGFDWSARIQNYAFKSDFTYYLNPKNTIEFGWQSTYFYFEPGKVEAYFETTKDNLDTFQFKVPSIPAMESALYLSNEQKIGARITLSYGIRYSGYAQLGRGKVYKYPNGQPVNLENPGLTVSPIDSTIYKDGEIVKLYHGIEPRFSINYLIDEQSSLKGSYNRMRQYIHLISNTTAATPVDIYMPSGEYIKPAIVDQWGIGYFRNYLDNKFESSLEVYYKNFENIVDYKDEAELLFNNTLETELFTGQGRTYGIEVQLKKKTGDLTGWISYTLSRVERQVEHINGGEYYPANWNKTHNVNLVLTYDITKKWNAATSFAYMSGRPITYPDGRFTHNNIPVPIYKNRNGAITPAYHRLDLSMTYTQPVKRKWLYRSPFLPFKYLWKETPESLEEQDGEISLAFGCYNVYGRKNPYSIYFQQDSDNPEITKAFRLSIYAIPIPYVTFNFKF